LKGDETAAIVRLYCHVCEVEMWCCVRLTKINIFGGFRIKKAPQVFIRLKRQAKIREGAVAWKKYFII
jgi:hypothetical protein